MVIYGGDPDHCLGPGIFSGFFIIAIISNIAGVRPWHRSAISK